MARPIRTESDFPHPEGRPVIVYYIAPGADAEPCDVTDHYVAGGARCIEVTPVATPIASEATVSSVLGKVGSVFEHLAGVFDQKAAAAYEAAGWDDSDDAPEHQQAPTDPQEAEDYGAGMAWSEAAQFARRLAAEATA